MCSSLTLLHHTLNRVCKVSSLRGAGLLSPLGLLLVGCGSSITSSPTGGPSRATPTRAFVGLVDLGSGRKMTRECRAGGSPTVVLVAGLDAAADV